MGTIRICLIGDRNDEVIAHKAIPPALVMSSEAIGLSVEPVWIATTRCRNKALEDFHGLWCVPASPYQSMEGSLHAIRFARENRRPFLGTCGGFQHALIEYARNVLGWVEADHAETNPNSFYQVISPLSCSLVESEGTVLLEPGSALRSIYGKASTTEKYHCNFGVNPEFVAAFSKGGLRFSARDSSGDIRAFEFPLHPFFIGTLFQPERAALLGRPSPLVNAFVKAAAAGAMDQKHA